VCARCRDILLSRYGVELVELNIVRLGVAGAAQARLFRGTVATKGLETARILYQANLEAGKIHEQADAEATRMQVEAIEQAAAIQADALIEADRIVRPVEARDPELAGLVRAVNSYRAAMDADTTLILEGGNEFFRLLERRPEGSAQKSAAPSTRPTTQSTRPTTQTTRP
jgi:modulator of FtsH protease HflC